MGEIYNRFIETKKQASKDSFTDKIGQKVASEHCTIIDDGTIKNRRGSMNFDDEGTDSACNILIEKGILKGYMQDKQNAMLMNMKSTGNGRRESYERKAYSRMTNTYFEKGTSKLEDMIAKIIERNAIQRLMNELAFPTI